MKSSTGRWVSGEDFFDRERELQVLETRVRDGNHILLTGQRRMGKTSVARELGRRLEDHGWIFLFADVEGATCAEDVIADIAKAVYPVRNIASRFASTMQRWIGAKVEEISAYEFRVKIRAGLDAGSWRRYGEQLLQPIVLHRTDRCSSSSTSCRFFSSECSAVTTVPDRSTNFLAGCEACFKVGDRSLVLLVSGSIGIAPLVKKLGIPDRINHLHTYRLGPWDRDTSVECFHRLAETYELRTENGVANAVVQRTGSGHSPPCSILLCTVARPRHHGGS